MKLKFIALLLNPLLLFSQSYDYYFDGDTSNIVTATDYGICLMGGATENDQGSQWFLNKSNGGNILVLRTSGGNGYQNYFYNSLGVTVQSVETIVLNDLAAASDPFVLRKIENAEAIWLTGGDQYLYESYFKNSTIETLLNEHVNLKGAPIGGTSAGMAILGQFYFNAENGTITSTEALNNPYALSLTVQSDFIDIPLLQNTITDTHYDNPDRKGRHITFIARMQEENVNEDYFGIAADEYVAICIEENGIATVYGEHPDFDDNAYFIRTNCQRSQPSVLQNNTPLTWSGNDPAILACNIKGTNDGLNQFNLNTWLDLNGGNWEGWSVDQGNLTTEQIQHTGCTSSVLEFKSKHEEDVVFPNPTNDIVHINSSQEISRIELYDVQGKQLSSFDKTEHISLKNFDKGIYYLRIINQNDDFVVKKITLIE